MEMAPTGNGFRMKTRFSKFSNVPEMLRVWLVFADVKTAADLRLPTHDLSALSRSRDGRASRRWFEADGRMYRACRERRL